MPDLKISTAALRADAKEWRSHRATIAPAKGMLQQIPPHNTFVPNEGEAISAANRIVNLLDTLAGQAAEEFEQIAGDLCLNADYYEQHEEQLGQHVKDAY